MEYVQIWHSDGRVQIALEGQVVGEAGTAAELADTLAGLPVLPEPALPEAPEAVASWAAKAVLERAGLLERAEQAAEAAGVEWKWRFRQGVMWERSNVQALRGAMAMDEAEVDALLREAAALASL